MSLDPLNNRLCLDSSNTEFYNAFYVEGKGFKGSANPIAVGVTIDKKAKTIQWGSLGNKAKTVHYDRFQIKDDKIIVKTDNSSRYVFTLLTKEIYEKKCESKTFPINHYELLDSDLALQNYFRNQLRLSRL